jgi:serine phosphatase RsbU (regulator of sigma subunit)/pSer/pThr/pTyr-binding forkhead associated (FHA) protein
MPPSIHFLAGPQKGLDVVFGKDAPVFLGRDPQSEVRLEENNASRLHAELVWDGRELKLIDAGSKNGVFVNGVRRSDAKLQTGDIVMLASSVFRVERSAEPAARERPTATRTEDPSDTARTCLPALESCAEYQRIVGCLLRIQGIIAAGREDIVEESLEALFTILPATRLSLLSVGGDGELSQRHTVTRSGPSVEYVGRSFARRVLAAGRAILVENADALGSADWSSTLQLQKVRSSMGVPVYAGGAIAAVLLCDNLEEPNVFTTAHLGLLTFAGRAMQAAFQHDALRALERKQYGLDQQLLAARVVQDQIFNKDPESITGPVRWWVHNEPALEVGGDFYDFHTTPERTLWVIADVCGKGVPAALVVSMLKAFCKSLYPQRLSPAAFARALHGLTLGELPRDMFFTAAIVSVDAAGVMTYASCGQDGGLHLRGAGDVRKLPITPALMGMEPMSGAVAQVEELRIELQPGDRVFLCTDGVLEAGAATDQYGIDRVIDILAKASGVPGTDALHRIVESVHEHEGTAVAEDDMTLLLAEFTLP